MRASKICMKIWERRFLKLRSWRRKSQKKKEEDGDENEEEDDDENEAQEKSFIL